MARQIETITIIGVGLIGGSVAAAAKASAREYRVYGISTTEESLQFAKEKGYLDDYALPGTEKADGWLSGDASDLVVIATPVDASFAWLDRIAELGYTGILTDVASTKGLLCDHAEEVLSHKELFVPGHPMSGRETSGVEFASATLFQGATWILCPDEGTDPDAYQALHEFVVSLEARVVSLDRHDHDEVIATVSHVPHMVASCLVRLAGQHAANQPNLFRLTGGGFRDTTRIAAGSPELWCGIAFDNKDAIVEELSEMGQIIGELETAIRDDDERKVTEMLEYSAKLRGDLPARWIPLSERLVKCDIPMYNRKGVIAEVTTIASKVGCNIQSITIKHVNEESAVLELIFTDEGDIGQLTGSLINGGFDVAFRHITPSDITPYDC